MNKTTVVDTNVLISALISHKGANRAVLRACLRGGHTPLISNALFQEYEDVSGRESIQRQCALSTNEIRELLNAFYNVCRWTAIHYLWRPNLLDEDDNFLIELAVAGNAANIVTNNVRDFMNAELLFPSIQILRPHELLRES